MTVDVQTLDTGRARLHELLVRHAYQKKRVTLASGRESDFYIDCRGVVLSAEGHALVGRLVLQAATEIDPHLQAVGGLTMGADPLASAVALTSWLDHRPVGAFLVRKEPKGHGTGQWCEGLQLLPPGARAVVVEDVITTGGSSLKAVERAREAGLQVSGVVALVDREEGGRENLERAGLLVRALFARRDFPSV
jgi:orotate phosphoribosyltransferase